MHFSTVAKTSQLLLLSMLVSASLAVFYTRSTEQDYPRIGRRSFYTTGRGKHYPRIGRRAASDVLGNLIPSSQGSASSGSVSSSSADSGKSSAASGLSPSSAAVAAFSELAKRGVFTQTSGGYPRVGKRAGLLQDYMHARRAGILQKLAELSDERQSSEEMEEERMDDAVDTTVDEDEEMERGAGSSSSSGFPLELMFIVFDSNGDGLLSKEEFTSGMRKYKQQNASC